MHRRIFLLLSLLAALTVSAIYPSYYANSSKLATGHWVKIATDSEGIYQLTYEQLRQMGFADPSKVQVYGYGAVQLTGNVFVQNGLPAVPDDLQPTATLHTADGRILFFGQGDVTVSLKNLALESSPYTYDIRRNYYDTRSYYFLSDAQGALPIPTTEFVGSENEPLMAHHHIELYEEELHSACKGGIAYHGKHYEPGDNVNYNCHIVNFKPVGKEGRGMFTSCMAIGATGRTSTTISVSDNVNVQRRSDASVSSVSASDFIVFNNANSTLTFGSSASKPLDDAYATFTIATPSSTAVDYLADDYAILHYPRANELDNNACLVMNHIGSVDGAAGTIHRFGGVNANEITLWNVDCPYEITQYTPSYDADEQALDFSFDRLTKHTVAFRADAAFPAPEVLGDVVNQDLHAADTPAMLIITTRQFMESANKIAEAHRRYQGMDVLVVDHNQIYNEFSSGSRDAMAYRRFAKMFYDRDPAKFKYILLLGTASYDNRSIEVPKLDRLISYQTWDPYHTRSSVSSYCSDNYFGMLDDSFSHSLVTRTQMDVAVGRVPSITPEQAAAYAHKVENYLANPYSGEAYGRVMLLSGEQNNNTHYLHQEEVATTMLAANPAFTFVKVPIQIYQQKGTENKPNITPQKVVENELKDGIGYVTFSGHGGQDYISLWRLLDGHKASTYRYDVLPFAMFSSCDQFAFDHMKSGLLETMLFNPSGGAVAGVAATREVYISFNQASCVPVAQAYATATPGETYGEMYVRSREISLQRVGSSESAQINVMTYTFGGDPALPIRLPALSACLTSINGLEPTEADPVEPLEPIEVEGCIVNGDGDVDETFNGKVEIVVYDGAVTATTYNTMSESNYTPISATLEYDVLARCPLNVVDGQFKGSIVLPFPAVNADAYRVRIVAKDDNTNRSALADGGVLAIDLGKEQVVEDYEAPHILDFYVDSADLPNGGEVASTIQLTAVIDPSTSGLNLSTNGIRTSTRIIIDGMRDISYLNRYISAQPDGTMLMHTTVDGLGEGIHNIEFIVANNAGKTDRASVDVTVVTRRLSATLAVEQQPARTQADIAVDGSYTADNRLVINSPEGSTVFSAENVSFPYTWNLTATDGSPVPDGRYTVSLLMHDGSYYGNTPAAEIVVLR